MTKHGVSLVGHTNVPSMVAADASSLYAHNLLDFLNLIVTKEGAPSQCDRVFRRARGSELSNP
ncbi:NAD/NADP transhydrogenase alpha subunit [Paraburkholderia sp. 40]